MSQINQQLAGLFTPIDVNIVGGGAGGGPVVVTNTPLPVSGTFFQATQPVSVASLPALSGTSNVAVTNFPATQPISAVALPALSGTTNVSIGTVTQTGNSLNANITNAASSLWPVAGTQANGTIKATPVTSEGHIEVAIHGPVGAFGDVMTSTVNPMVQIDAVYGINAKQIIATTSGIGTATTTNGMFTCSTAGGVGAFGSIQSRRRLRYRAGQGLIMRFTARFTTPLPSTYQLVGVGHAEDGMYVGYNGINFGLLYVRGGLRTVQNLTVTTGATVGGNVIINGTNVAVTASSNKFRTAYEISQQIIPNYTTNVVTIGGDPVVRYISNSAANLALITFDANGTNTVATPVVFRAGAASVDTWVYQPTWNVDKLDGTGSSAVTLDPTKLNVYQFNIQYLGAGAIAFLVETTESGNNAHFDLAHVFNFPNTLTAPSFTIPVFPFTMTAYDLGLGNNVTCYSGSAAGFLEGRQYLTGNTGAWARTLSGTVTAASFFALFTINCASYFDGRVNQCQIILTQITCALDHNNPIVFYMIKSQANVTDTLALAGNVSFVPYDSASSIANIDEAATTLTFSNNQIMWAGTIGSTGQIQANLFTDSENFSIQPGEMVTVCARSVGGTATFASASIMWREDV